MSDQEHRDQLQCSVRNERQQQQRATLRLMWCREPKVAKVEKTEGAAAKVLKSRQVTRLSHTHSSPHYTDLGSQLQTLPQLITCITLPLCDMSWHPQQSFIQIPPEPEPKGNSCPLPGRVTGDIFSLLSWSWHCSLLSPLHSWLLSSSMRTLSSHDAVMNLTDQSEIKLTIEQ